MVLKLKFQEEGASGGICKTCTKNESEEVESLVNSFVRSSWERQKATLSSYHEFQ